MANRCVVASLGNRYVVPVPKIIRQALGERIRRDPELQQLLSELSLALGVPVGFAGPLGQREDIPDAQSAPLCARLRQDSAGCRLCATFQQTLLETAGAQPVTRRCDAGLNESAVPLRAAGHTLGFLVIGGYISEPPGTTQINRARHLLARAGVHLPDSELQDLLQRSSIVPAARQQAMVNVLQLAAEHLTAKLTARLIEPGPKLPPLIEQACRIVRAEFAHPVSVPDLARRLGSSEGHLSRTFHRSTGLRLVEYVARFRAERAQALLRDSERPVTEIAFACGFQSLSQFNRVFRAQFGIRPSDVRVETRSERVGGPRNDRGGAISSPTESRT